MSDEKLLDRVGKMLEMAERGATQEERDAFMEKAQQMATEASIDLAKARAHRQGAEKREEVEERRVQVNPYDRRYFKSRFVDLFTEIAAANDGRCLMNDYNVWVTAFPSDADIIEALFASLSVQMVAAADEALKRGDHSYTGYLGLPQNGRSFRADFYDGFIRRIGRRLLTIKRQTEQAAKEAEVEATEKVPASGADIEQTGTALALRDKKTEVNDAYEQRVNFIRQANRGRVSTYKGSQSPQDSSSAARAAGMAAADRAKIGAETEVGSRQRQAIG